MCTVSWVNQPDGYTLYFNRDESRDRSLATPPEIVSEAGTKFICPRDPQAGGTWLLVNEYGISICLLNYYEAQVDYQPSSPQSRGNLPLLLKDSSTLEELQNTLTRHDLTPYPPFHLLAVAPNATSMMLTWSGKETTTRTITTKDLPVTTSSFETKQVLAHRIQLYKTLSQEIYHTHHDPNNPAYSPNMARSDALTVSISKVVITPEQINFTYTPRDPETLMLQSSNTTTLRLSQ